MASATEIIESSLGVRALKFKASGGSQNLDPAYSSQIEDLRIRGTEMEFKISKSKSGCPSFHLKGNRSKVAEPTGLEPATSDVTGRRSNQLNYDSAFSDLKFEI